MKILWRLNSFLVVAVLLQGINVRAEFAPAPIIITVTNSADSGTGSLRDAIGLAGDGDTIVFSLDYPATITLTSGQLLISNRLTISGPGRTNLALSGNYTDRVISTTSNAEVTISGLTITKGLTAGNGGGINNDHAMLVLSNCDISGNESPWGGGIYVNGSSGGSAALQIINCTLSNNLAGDGGGIFSDTRFGRASVQISKSLVSGNTASFGGGIFSGGTEGSVTLEIDDSILSSNCATIGNAGGILNDGFFSGTASLLIVNSTICGNSAGNVAGAILNNGQGGSASVVLINCALSENSAYYDGGGIYNVGSYGGLATLLIENSTLAGNSATVGNGGGIFNYAAAAGWVTAQILNSTLSGNSANTGGAIVSLAPSPMEIGSTIVNAGQAGGSIANYSVVNSLGYNLSSDDGGGLLTNVTDQINADPMLGPLQDNGGPTFTQVPQIGSPAIDKGYNFAGTTTDQRGFPRPYDKPGIPNAVGGDGSDIGAVEVQDWPPIADASATRLLIISRNCGDAPAVLDGTHSSDPDGDSLQYRWYNAGAANPLAVGVVAVITLPLGTHPLQLVVDDGKLTDTNAFTIDVITPADALNRLVTTIKVGIQHPQPLLASLAAAADAVGRKNYAPAVNELRAFQNKIRGQIQASAPAFAESVIQSAQQVISALMACDGKSANKPNCQLGSWKRRPDGCFHLEYAGAASQRYILEASANLVDWEMVGVATSGNDGSFAFDDAQASNLSSRFYRVVEAPE